MTQTNNKPFSPSERDLQFMRLATAYSNSTDARARNMIRGKAQKLINQTYKVETNREAVWSEWCKLADAKGWILRGGEETVIIKATSLRQDTLDAYEAAKVADNAWQAELDRLKIDRYTLAARGERDSELRRLRDAKVEADRKYHELCELLRRYQDPVQAGLPSEEV